MVLSAIHGLASAGSGPVEAEVEGDFSVALGPPPPENHKHIQYLLSLPKGGEDEMF